MSKFSMPKGLLAVFAAAVVAGACLHFLFDLLPNPVTALFAPVNESIWEHLKLIYWPYLAAMAVVTRKGGRGSRGGWLFSLLLISVAMLAVGYVYHISLGCSSLSFDIGLYVILMALGFWLPGRLSRFSGVKAFSLLTVGLGAVLILFTFLPPDHILFADLSVVNTWYTIPY